MNRLPNTVSRNMLLNFNVAFWGIPGLIYMITGMYLTFNSVMREPALGAAILIFYVAILLPKKAVNAHIKFLSESEEYYIPIRKFTTLRLSFVWIFHMLLPVGLYYAFGRDSILFLSLLDICALLLLTYSFRYMSTFYRHSSDEFNKD